MQDDQEAPEAHQPPTDPGRDPMSADHDAMSAESLLRNIQDNHTVRPRPTRGWKAALYDMTNGYVNLGPSDQESYEARLIEDIQAPLSGVNHVTVWSQKGGVGKTTTSVLLGITLAQKRVDKILALDVNPDGGSMAVRVPRTTDRTVVDLRDALRAGYVPPSDFDTYTNHAPHRLDSIVMPPGMKVGKEEILTGDDYTMIARALEERYPYRIILTDCGTNLTDSVMEGVIPRTDQLVVVTTTVKDEATVTAGGLEALSRSGFRDLVENAITVVVNKAPKDPHVEVQREIAATTEEIKGWFRRITGTVIEVPYDPRIRIGSVVDPQRVGEETNRAQLELARAVVLGLEDRNRR